jgi:hypothetical protein
MPAYSLVDRSHGCFIPEARVIFEAVAQVLSRGSPTQVGGAAVESVPVDVVNVPAFRPHYITMKKNATSADITDRIPAAVPIPPVSRETRPIPHIYDGVTAPMKMNGHGVKSRYPQWNGVKMLHTSLIGQNAGAGPVGHSIDKREA